MLKRDEETLSFVKRYDVRELFVNTLTGKIVGIDLYTSMKFFERYVDFSHITTFKIEEYEWLTDETRDRKVTTAADLYDKIEWTSKGFKIDGENVPIN